MLHPTEIENCLERLVVLVDSREHDTERFRRRMNELGLWERRKLDYGDYSAISIRDNGEEVSLIGKVHIERKMSLGEIIGNFTEDGKNSPAVVAWNGEHLTDKVRNRFEWELKRAKLDGAKIIIVIENGSWEQIYGHKYQSKMVPTAVIATFMAYMARYDVSVYFVNDRLSGQFIHDILRYYMREELKRI